jgi:small membrane protein
MTLIQPLLIVLILLALVIYMSRLRSSLADRCIVIGITIAGIVLIAAPDLSTAIAHSLGVGRGVDLVIYLSLIGLGFSSLFLFSRLRSVEAAITAIVRELSIGSASSGLDRSPAGRSGEGAEAGFTSGHIPPGNAPSA